MGGRYIIEQKLCVAELMFYRARTPYDPSPIPFSGPHARMKKDFGAQRIFYPQPSRTLSASSGATRQVADIKFIYDALHAAPVQCPSAKALRQLRPVSASRRKNITQSRLLLASRKRIFRRIWDSVRRLYATRPVLPSLPLFFYGSTHSQGNPRTARREGMLERASNDLQRNSPAVGRRRRPPKRRSVMGIKKTRREAEAATVANRRHWRVQKR